MIREPLHDTWRTLVPAPDDAHGPLAPLLIGLTFTTGICDAYSYLELGHVFVANMTGNVVFVGFAVAGAAGFSILRSLLALGAFSLGAVLGGQLTHRAGRHRGQLLAISTTIECLLVFTAFLCAELIQITSDDQYALILLLAIGLGMQNATVRKLAVPDLTTTVLTMTLTGMSADGPLAGGEKSKLGRRLLSIVTMCLGALVGAAVALHGSAPIDLAIAAGLLGVIAVVAHSTARSDAPWTNAV